MYMIIYDIIKAIMYQNMDEATYEKANDIMTFVFVCFMTISGFIMLVAPRLGVKDTSNYDSMRTRAFGLILTTGGILIIIASIG